MALSVRTPRAAAVVLAAVAVGAIVAPPESQGQVAGQTIDKRIVLQGAARAGKQIQAVGPRSAWLGFETGELEAWIYPLKVVRDLSLAFEFRNRRFDAAELARSVVVEPESTSIVYSHEAFRVTQTLVAVRDEPALLMLLQVDASFPVAIDVEFHIDLVPMWPASLGGQYSQWREDLPGFAIGEGTGRNAALIASPAAVEPTRQPAHSLPEHPTRFRIRAEPGQALIPIAIVARGAAHGAPAGDTELRELYERLVAEPTAPAAAARTHYDRLLASARFTSSDVELNAMLAWARIRLDQGLVCNPHLGCGLIAGYGAARAGYRPGFNWFFGGDAFYNSWALAGSAQHETVRQALEFLAKYQRDDGKIMHELSQGAAYVEWFGDYPYGYYHAETTPYFVGAIAAHAQQTGDREWVETMLPALRKALDYCLSADGDGDGLMENTIAGLGAVEMGALREARVHQDIYLASVWIHALERLAWLGDWIDDRALAQTAEETLSLATAALDATWLAEKGHYAFATHTDGSVLDELTLWSVLPAGLATHVSDTMRRRAVAAVASPAVTADWGTRMLAQSSPLYDPLIYNQGTVWPFLTGFALYAAYAADQPWYGEDLLHGLVQLGRDDMLGAWPEVLSGDRYEPMGPSVPNQLFSASSLVSGVYRGLMGVEADVAGQRLGLRPRLPADMAAARVDAMPFGHGTVTVDYNQSTDALETRVAFQGAGRPPELRVNPLLPPGGELRGVEGVEPATGLARWSSTPDGWSSTVVHRWDGGIRFAVRRDRPTAGARSEGLRVMNVRWDADGQQVLADVAGTVGVEYVIETEALVRFVGPMSAPGAMPSTGVTDRIAGTPGLRVLVLEGPEGAVVGATLALRAASQ